jgi:hypothetical protein
MGLVERVRQVMVVEDAIKHLPITGEPELTYKRWREAGVLIKTLAEVKNLIIDEF